MVSIIAEDVRHLHILILRHFGEGGMTVRGKQSIKHGTGGEQRVCTQGCLKPVP